MIRWSISLVIFAASLWVAVDSTRLGARRGAAGGGLSDMGPVGWFFSCLLIWVVAFPLYLFHGRPRLVRAQRLTVDADHHGYLPYGYPAYPGHPSDPGYGPNPGYAAHPGFPARPSGPIPSAPCGSWAAPVAPYPTAAPVPYAAPVATPPGSRVHASQGWPSAPAGWPAVTDPEDGPDHAADWPPATCPQCGSYAAGPFCTICGTRRN